MHIDFEKEKEKFAGYEQERHYLLDTGIVSENSKVIIEELEWFQSLLDNRVNFLKGETAGPVFFSSLKLPELKEKKSAYADLVNTYGLSPSERLLLLCGLLPHISPEIFTKRLRSSTTSYKVEYPELGGYFDSTFINFVPTMQTVLCLLAGDDITNMVFYQLSLRKSVLVNEQIINLRPSIASEDDSNERNHIIALAPEFVRYLLCSEKPRPDFGRSFPATLTCTSLEWDDLVLNPKTRSEVEEVMNWVKASEKLNRTKKIRPGFPCLFYGPPGTGKTMTTALIGKTFGKDVFRVDLSMIVSKYVGETEKNLSHLFDRAENKDCILFFDEADSLFSKRTEVNSSNDKWANLEMSYLLQRMEEYKGLTILATNLKNNIDAAMTRRFQSMIYFPRPDKNERALLWKQSLAEEFSYPNNVSFEKLSKYELTGANISNILKYCCTEALAKEQKEISGADLVKGIHRELAKENRTV
jgi:hypothetical protein